MTLDEARAELAKRLQIARQAQQATDLRSQAFASGHAAGLEYALELIGKVLEAKPRLASKRQRK